MKLFESATKDAVKQSKDIVVELYSTFETDEKGSHERSDLSAG